MIVPLSQLHGSLGCLRRTRCLPLSSLRPPAPSTSCHCCCVSGSAAATCLCSRRWCPLTVSHTLNTLVHILMCVFPDSRSDRAAGRWCCSVSRRAAVCSVSLWALRLWP